MKIAATIEPFIVAMTSATVMASGMARCTWLTATVKAVQSRQREIDRQERAVPRSFALREVGGVFEVLVHQEDDREHGRDDEIHPALREVVQLQLRPRDDHRHRRADQDDGVDGAEPDIELAMRPLER